MTKNEEEGDVAAQVGRATNSVWGEGAAIRKYWFLARDFQNSGNLPPALLSPQWSSLLEA